MGIIAVAVVIVSGVYVLNDDDMISSNITDISLSATSEKSEKTDYVYNTICELGHTPQEIFEKPVPISMEIIQGMHNDNIHVIEYFEIHPVLKSSNLTPEQAFGTIDEPGVGANYDPLFSDTWFWTPVALKIMNINPEVIASLEIREWEELSDYENRITAEISKCS